jgi:hypothetical protein
VTRDVSVEEIHYSVCFPVISAESDEDDARDANKAGLKVSKGSDRTLVEGCSMYGDDSADGADGASGLADLGVVNEEVFACIGVTEV